MTGQPNMLRRSRPLPEDGITTNTPTMSGRNGYFLTPSALRRVKKAAKFANLRWQAEASRPSTVKAFLNLVEREMNN